MGRGSYIPESLEHSEVLSWEESCMKAFGEEDPGLGLRVEKRKEWVGTFLSPGDQEQCYLPVLSQRGLVLGTEWKIWT